MTVENLSIDSKLYLSMSHFGLTYQMKFCFPLIPIHCFIFLVLKNCRSLCLASSVFYAWNGPQPFGMSWICTEGLTCVFYLQFFGFSENSEVNTANNQHEWATGPTLIHIVFPKDFFIYFHLHLLAGLRFLWATCLWSRYSFHKASHIPSMW